MRKLTTLALATWLVTAATPAMAQVSMASAMTENDLRATGLSTEWQSGINTITMGEDGKVMFLYGKAQPTIVCAPMRLCDLELENGEEVMDVFSGDSVRWQFEGARSGPNGSTPHLLIKPIEAGHDTTLVITTDRRTYSIQLKSSVSRYMARVGFDYSFEPRDVIAAMKADPAPAPMFAAPPPEPEIKYVATLPNFKSVEDLNFNYRIKGKAKWKPIRVFDDGVKTYIEFDDSINNQELPVFMVEGSEGKDALVNSRFIDNRYIVDRLFDEGYLLLGTGRKQQTVTIKRDD